MMNARAVTETMNIQWRQQKFTYWRKSNVRSGGSVSTLVGTLNATFIGSDPRYPLRQISDRAMGIAAGDDSKAPAPPSNSRKSICSKMHAALLDVADAVHPDPTLTRSWSGRFPNPWGLMLTHAHCPGRPCARERIKTVLGVMRPGEARNG